MSNFDPHRYTITIKLVTLEEGEYFEAVVGELPDLVEYGETYDQAYSLVVDSIATLNEAAIEQGRMFPEPMPSQALEEFSGRVTLRMSKSLHASVSKLAEREGVSLNSWIVESISARAGAGFSTWAVERASRTATARAFNVISREGVSLNSWMVEAISARESASSTASAVTYMRRAETGRVFNVMSEQTLGKPIHKTTWINLMFDSLAVNQVLNLTGTTTQMSTVDPVNPMLMQ